MYSFNVRTHLTLPSVFRHVGRPQDFLDQYRVMAHQAAAKGADAVREEIGPHLIKCIADERNLRCAWDWLGAKGGHAPGPNGLTFGDLRDPEIWPLMRVLGATLKEGTYRPGAVREVQIPKGPGRGMRTLTIANIEDRVVQRAVLQGLQPLLDPFFSPLSFGGRPRRGCVDALAVAAVTAQSDDRWCWITADIRNAFDNVPLNRLMDVVRKRLPCDEFVRLADRIVDPGRRRGIPQGGPLSSLLLNVYLDHFLDRPWAKEFPKVPLLRFVDDVLILARPSDDPPALLERLVSMLQTCGLPIREQTGPSAGRDLVTGESVNWLGFELSKEGAKMAAHLEAGWAEHLHANLILAHEKTWAPIRARKCIGGWLGWIGPAYPHMDRRQVLEEIRLIGHEYSFDELPSIRRLNRPWRLAFKRYQKRLALAVEGRAAADNVTRAVFPTNHSTESDAAFSESRRRKRGRRSFHDWKVEDAPF